jgi:hypothetical protein
MSRGLGRIECKIIAILKSRAGYWQSFDVFDAEDLGRAIDQWQRVHRDAKSEERRRERDDKEFAHGYHEVPRRHRVSIIRAMHLLAPKFPRRYGLTGGKGRTPLAIYRTRRPPILG